jgi:hypothetical protein
VETVNTEHSESLKSRIIMMFVFELLRYNHLKYKDLSKHTTLAKWKNESDTSNAWVNWNLPEKYLSNILGKHEINKLQKTARFVLAPILWRVLMSKYQTFNMGNNITCTVNCNNRMAAIVYTLQT